MEKPISIRFGAKLTRLITGHAISKGKDKTEVVKEILREYYCTGIYINPREVEALERIYDKATPEERKNPGRL